MAVTACDPSTPTPPTAAPLASSVGAATTTSAPAAPAKKTARSWNFDSVAAGTRPTGFGAEVGKWQVVPDDPAPSGGKVLAQLAASAGPVFNIALVGGTDLADVDVSVKLRAVEGRVDQGGGVVWRAQDARNYYIARYNPLEDNYRVYKVVAGRRSQLRSATLKVDHAAWHTLRVTMIGDQISCYLDATLHLETRDTTFGEAGRIGLWTKADAKTNFDDLTVSAPR
jgi:hypothetical protein